MELGLVAATEHGGLRVGGDVGVGAAAPAGRLAADHGSVTHGGPDMNDGRAEIRRWTLQAWGLGGPAERLSTVLSGVRTLGEVSGGVEPEGVGTAVCVCGRTFEQLVKRQRYCGATCRRWAAAKERLPEHLAAEQRAAAKHRAA